MTYDLIPHRPKIATKMAIGSLTDSPETVSQRFGASITVIEATSRLRSQIGNFAVVVVVVVVVEVD
mgnify:CR=1 FL=1